MNIDPELLERVAIEKGWQKILFLGLYEFWKSSSPNRKDYKELPAAEIVCECLEEMDEAEMELTRATVEAADGSSITDREVGESILTFRLRAWLEWKEAGDAAE